MANGDVIPRRQFWFVSFYAVRSNISSNTVIDETPAVWSYGLSQSPSIKDGPYVIIYAEEITEAQYKQWQGAW